MAHQIEDDAGLPVSAPSQSIGWSDVAGDYDVAYAVRRCVEAALGHQVAMVLESFPRDAIVAMAERVRETKASDAMYEQLSDTHDRHRLLDPVAMEHWLLQAYAAVFRSAGN